MTESDEYLKPWLDLYLQTNGNPTEQDRQDTLAEYPELSITRPKKTTQITTPGSQAPGTPESQVQPGSNPETTTPEELDPELKKAMDELMKNQ